MKNKISALPQSKAVEPYEQSQLADVAAGFIDIDDRLPRETIQALAGAQSLVASIADGITVLTEGGNEDLPARVAAGHAQSLLEAADRIEQAIQFLREQRGSNRAAA